MRFFSLGFSHESVQAPPESPNFIFVFANIFKEERVAFNVEGAYFHVQNTNFEN
jgi:hypothetical protein